MRSKKRVLCISLIALSLSACSFLRRDKDEKKILPPNYIQQKEALKAFEAANALFDDEDYMGASKAYDKILVETPVSTLDGLIMFNSGLAHQMNGECETAVGRYRKVIRFTRKRKAEALSLRAKLRLSDAYSCLGQTNKAMVLLVEVFKDRKRLSPAIGLAEVPAKLAAGYSRQGNRKMADHYFNIADQGLRILEAANKDSKDQSALLSKTLFTMGDTSQVKFDRERHINYFRTLKTLQKYLLRSITYQVEPWSTKAVKQIVQAYEYTWQMVDAVQPTEGLNKTRGGREVKVKRGKIIQSALDSIRELEGHKLPTEKTPEVQKLFKRLQRTKLKMRNYLVAEVPGSELTQEAKYLQGDKREGRVKSKPTVLEKKSKTP